MQYCSENDNNSHVEDYTLNDNIPLEERVYRISNFSISKYLYGPRISFCWQPLSGDYSDPLVLVTYSKST